MAWGRRQGDGEWYTPPSIVEAAREAMGGIDCDPASCAVAQRVVRAAVYHSLDDDGLAHAWRGSVFLNPPWGVPTGDSRYRSERSAKGQFAAKLAYHYRRGDVHAAVVVLSYDLSPKWYNPLAEALSAICLVRDRVYYYRDVPDDGVRDNKGTSVTYLGPDPGRFAAAFGPMGLVVVPHRPCPTPT